VRPIAFMRPLALLAALLAAASGRLSADPAVTPLSASQSTYLQRCGGCHGIQGISNPTVVPTLRGQVGQFLCTQEGREYLLRLPSIATSPLSDRQVADLMNFVVFSLGDAQPDAVRAPLFQSGEVHESRRKPLNEVALVKYRAAVVEALIQRCGASPELRSYGGVLPAAR
jgi:mono/diheme cytochrome c family protein